MCKKIVAISDLHGYLPEIPECDLLLLAGDYNPYHRLPDQYAWMEGKFRTWFNALPAREVVWIGGNHDFACQKPDKGLLGAFKGHYLQDSGVELFGLKIYGLPWTPPFFDWAFMAHEDKLRYLCSQIPLDTDIVVSHGPPRNVRDKNSDGHPCGSYALWERMTLVRPRLCVFGHIHEGRGTHHQAWNGDRPTIFANVSHVNAQYKNVYPPMVFEDLFE